MEKQDEKPTFTYYQICIKLNLQNIELRIKDYYVKFSIQEKKIYSKK